MSFDPKSINFSLNESPRQPTVTDRDLLNELKRPLPTPDFSAPVMSKMQRAFPGVIGGAGRRQAFLWRCGIAAALALAATVGLYCSILQNEARHTAQANALPQITRAIESFEEQIEPGRMALISFTDAADRIARLMPTVVEQSAVSSEPEEKFAFVRQRRALFPVTEKYWFHSGSRKSNLGNAPKDYHRIKPTSAGNDLNDSATDPDQLREEWEETHSDAIPDTSIAEFFGIGPGAMGEQR